MVREITATIRTRAAVGSARGFATAIAIVLAGTLGAGCGIKGPLRLPPPTPATPSAPAPEKAAAPDANAEPVPAAESAAPRKP